MILLFLLLANPVFLEYSLIGKDIFVGNHQKEMAIEASSQANLNIFLFFTILHFELCRHLKVYFIILSFLKLIFELTLILLYRPSYD
jgi:hypothetical protein